MSIEECRKVTCEDIERVHFLIEKCIQKYMKEEEVVDVLYQHHNIEPCFTKIVWKQLEEENKKFFRNYHLRLILIDQITRFNELLEIQAALMKKQLNPNEVNAIPFDLPPSGLSNCESLGMQHSSDYPFITPSTPNPNAGMIEQGMNNVAPINNGSGGVGILASSSNNGIPVNSHLFQRTFTDGLSAFSSPLPGTSSDSNGIKIENQGENNRVPNISSNTEFQNSGLAQMSQWSNNFS